MLESDDGSQLLVVVFEQSKRPRSLSTHPDSQNETLSLSLSLSLSSVPD